MKPPSKNCENWPKCAFFGVFDGHGGYSCADFLRDNLHQFIVRDNEFPQNPKQAIINGFKNAETYFLEAVEKYSGGNISMLDKSGSCAITSLFVGKFNTPRLILN
jgi:protein phosphatase 2C family protein 2/3